MNCTKCDSDKVIPNVAVMDQGQYSNGLLQAMIAEKPQALFFKQLKMAKILANICGECGHTELFVDKPEVLYEAYLNAQKNTAE